jgi:hypothetical protein
MNHPPDTSILSIEYFTFDLLEEGVVILEDGYFQYFNKAARQLLHIPRNVNLKQHCASLFDQWYSAEKLSLTQLLEKREVKVTNVKNITGSTELLNAKISIYNKNKICCIFKLVGNLVTSSDSGNFKTV